MKIMFLMLSMQPAIAIDHYYKEAVRFFFFFIIVKDLILIGASAIKLMTS
jgi:hypothetical protein